MRTSLRRYFPLLLCAFLCACSGQVTFPEPPPRNASFVREPPADAPLARISANLTAKHPRQSGVYPVTSAHHALALRLASIRAARDSIDSQYFIFRRDDTGLLLGHELLRAAERGVRVRFLLDDFSTGDADQVLLALARHPNIEIRLFNPFPHRGPRAMELLADFRRLHRRMHNKSFTVDQRITFVGGRNLSNKYFGIDREINFGDLELVAIGAVVPDIAQQFDLYWNSAYSFPVQSVIRPPRQSQRDFIDGLERNGEKLRQSDYGQSLEKAGILQTLSANADIWYWGKSRALFDPPRKVESLPPHSGRFAGGELIARLLGARRQLIVISPYLYPGDEVLRQLAGAARRGVEIHILTNSLASTEIVLTHGAYRKYRRPLLKAGVHLYEMSSELKYKLDNWSGESRSLLHAKAYVVDGHWLYVGSFNLNHRSILLNTELGLLVDSPQLAGAVARNFVENVRDNAYTLELRGNRILWRRADGAVSHRDPDAGWLRRLGSRLSSWLPIESLL